MPSLSYQPQTILWIIFVVVIVSALGIDLGLKSHRYRSHDMSFREAIGWVFLWGILALGFGALVGFYLGHERMLEYFTAYLMEESLSVDNMFVFVLIFRYFHVAAIEQPKILKYGILGAIVMRLILLSAGIELIQRVHVVIYIFGVVLLITAVKLLFQGENPVQPQDNFFLKTLQRWMPLSTGAPGGRFVVQENGRTAATTLLAALVVVEASDLIFAMDSIPAVLAVSTHFLIVISSNIFAILGLRAIYFLIHRFVALFRFLRYGIALILMFIGTKMILSDILSVSTGLSLVVVVGLLAISVVASVVIPEKRPHPPSGPVV